MQKLYEMPDCISLTDSGKCNRLNINSCIGSECSFKQNQEEADISVNKSYERLSSCSRLTQEKIAKKYYNGTMPWNS